MIIVHMDSGLGNQMLDYAEYLAIAMQHPQEKCYIENLIYELPQKEGMYSIWNGYELEKIFGIQIPNVKELFNEKQWERILKSVERSEFWKNNWGYGPAIMEAFRKEGVDLIAYGKARKQEIEGKGTEVTARKKLTIFFNTKVGYHIKRHLRKLLAGHMIKKANNRYDIYQRYLDNSYVGHSFAFKYKGFGIEKIDDEIRKAFVFPKINDQKNKEMLSIIRQSNSVSIHARRSDLLFLNGYCYKYGFFKRSVHYIKKKVKDPVFVFFTDENSVGWCEQNERIFGLDFSKDKVYFVDWNKGTESFRDMQLMAECKHNIFTESTFGFWGAYLNRNPDKITCAPDPMILSTNSF